MQWKENIKNLAKTGQRLKRVHSSDALRAVDCKNHWHVFRLFLFQVVLREFSFCFDTHLI